MLKSDKPVWADTSLPIWSLVALGPCNRWYFPDFFGVKKIRLLYLLMDGSSWPNLNYSVIKIFNMDTLVSIISHGFTQMSWIKSHTSRVSLPHRLWWCTLAIIGWMAPVFPFKSFQCTRWVVIFEFCWPPPMLLIGKPCLCLRGGKWSATFSVSIVASAPVSTSLFMGCPFRKRVILGGYGKIGKVQKAIWLGVSPLFGRAEEHPSWNLKGIYSH